MTTRNEAWHAPRTVIPPEDAYEISNAFTAVRNTIHSAFDSCSAPDPDPRSVAAVKTKLDEAEMCAFEALRRRPA